MSPHLSMRTRLLAAVFAALALRLFFVWQFPSTAGDTRIYDELARNWLDHGVYGLWINGRLIPSDIRAPGYPAFLAVVYVLIGRTPQAVMLVQALLDVLTCFLAGGLAAHLAPPAARNRAFAGGVWLAALCPFVANYAAVALTEVLATFLTTASLFILLQAFTQNEAGEDTAGSSRLWFFGAFVTGLGTLVRPETPLLLAATALVLMVLWRRPASWSKLVRAGAWMAAGLLLVLLPWGARNYLTLHRVQFLAPRYAELPGEYVPRGFYAWTKTWLVRARDVYLVTWKIDDDEIPIEDVNATAFDTPEERARVAAILDRYNQDTTYRASYDAEFAQLARERTARHPMRTYLWVPLGRVLTFWFTPRVELLPASGHMFPLAEKWDEDRNDLLATLTLGALNFLFVGIALAGTVAALRRVRAAPAQSRCGSATGVWLIVTFVLLRTLFFTQVETPEPRYVVVCFPALMALGAQLWTRQKISS